MKVLTVVGARPQFVKAAVVSRALAPDHEEVLVHTGQHYDRTLSDVFFEELGLPEPDYNLGAGSGTHGEQIGTMLPKLERAIEQEAPDVVLVYGDTNSTMAAAVVVPKMAPALAHVEAGLRSGDWTIPEESNRVLTDHAADYLFAPTATAVDTLAGEGLADRTYHTGDVMYDAMLWARDHAAEASTVLDRLGLRVGEYTLATVHRAGNTDDRDRLAGIVAGLRDAPGPVVLPLHPRTEKQLRAFDLYDELAAAVELIEPVGYLDFVRLLDGAARVATDSGGVQKEATFLETPCVTMRERTEWPETVESGWNVLVDADPGAIARELERATERTPATVPDAFGDGDAAERIVEVLARE